MDLDGNNDDIPPTNSLFSNNKRGESNSVKPKNNQIIGYPDISKNTSVTIFGFPNYESYNETDNIVNKFRQLGEVIDIKTSNSNYVTIRYSNEDEAKRVLVYNGTFCGDPSYMIGVILTKECTFPEIKKDGPMQTILADPPPPIKIKRKYDADPESILLPSKKSKKSLLSRFFSYFY